MIIHNPILTGSFSVNGADLSTITGSVATSASFDARTTYLESTSSILTAASASQSVTSGSLVAASASLSATSGSLSVASGSFNTRVSALEATGSALSSSLLTVSGSGYATSGSLNTRVSALEVTGSALSSSLLTVSGSGYATSASLSTASGSFNTRVATIESKYATTGSNTFIGTQVVSGSVLQSGSFTTTGTLTAQTLVVQTITSSVVYSSGSNIFGNTIGNTQVFTGSVLVTGSLTIAAGGNISAPTIFGSTIACSPVGKFTSCVDAGSGTFSSNVCVGGGLVAQQASVFCNTVALFGASSELYIGGSSGASDYVILGWCSTNKSLNIRSQSSGVNPQLVIACNGNIGVKTTTAPNYDLEVKGNIGIISSTSAGLITTSTLCAAGTVTGLIRFDGLHSPSLTTYTGPSINACKDDANYATSLVFKTIDGSGGNNVNLRITGAGVACFASTVCGLNFLSSGNVQASGATSCMIINRTDGTPAVLQLGNAQNSFQMQFICTGGQRIAFINGAPTEFASFFGTGVACFASTITGTTIYGSTAVCSAVGYFSGCVGVGFTGYGGSKLTLVASTNPTCASSANMQLSIGEASQNTIYSFKLGYIYVGGGYVGAIQTIAGGVASTTLINPDGGNVGIGTTPYQNLTVLKNQNADTAIGIYNQTDGTASSTTLRFDNGSYNGQLNLYANLYTAAGTAVANTLRLYTDGPGGMSFSATNQHMRFYTSPNECLRMIILYGGSVGIGNSNPKHNLDVCSVATNAGGLAFCNMVTAQCVFSTFACVGTDSNIVTTITYTNTIDYNRSGVFVARWAYNDTCAALYIRSCLWNDSQNINSFGLRNNGGALQICLSGGGDSYRVQVLIQGSKAS